jgi:CHASE2 domain-containing sensor protein
VFSFFTIQSNAISGVVSAQLARRPARDGSGWRVLRLAALLGMLLGWLLYGPRPRVSARVVLWALTWPALYLAYTLIAGAISGWYPYPFLDAASNGYPRVFAAVGSFSGGGIDGYRHRNPLCVRRVQ